MVSWWAVGVLVMACVVFGAFCVATARACFRSQTDRTAYGVAGVWAACFGVTLVGSLMVRDAWGLPAAALFAGCVCVVSFPLCMFLGRHWRMRGMAAAVAYLQVHRPQREVVEGGWDSVLDATCARLARAYDLTRREEDVLRLLLEGCTFAEAADTLVVSTNTVKSHVRHIYAKMGVSGKQDVLDKVTAATRTVRGF